MTRYRILILYAQSLMLKGLLRRLAEQGNIEVVGVDAHQLDANDRARSFSPDVIIVDEDDIAFNGSLPMSELIRDYPEAKVIRIDPDSNAVSVLRQQKVVITDVGDLLRLLTTG